VPSFATGTGSGPSRHLSTLWALRPAVLDDGPAPPMAGDGVDRLLDALLGYRQSRKRLLASLGCPASNRDPLAEFSERLVAGLLGGALAASRVQKGHDLVTLAGQTVQVRYLANGSGGWVNEHTVSFDGHLDWYQPVSQTPYDWIAKLRLAVQAGGLSPHRAAADRGLLAWLPDCATGL
jgi:hypothetical protein